MAERMPMTGTERDLLAEWFDADREWKHGFEEKVEKRFAKLDEKIEPLMATHRQWQMAKKIGVWVGGIVTVGLTKLAWSWIGGS